MSLLSGGEGDVIMIHMFVIVISVNCVNCGILEAGKWRINSQVIWSTGNQPKSFPLRVSPRKEMGDLMS